MKHLAIIVLLFAFLSFAPAQMHNGEDISAVATFHGLSDLGVSGDAGLRIWMAPTVSVRATFGTVIQTGSTETKSFDVSGALLWTALKTDNTSASFGPTLIYQHSDPSNNAYTFGGVAQVCYSPSNRLTFFYEYDLNVSHDGDLTTITFGKSTGSLGIEVGL